MNLFFVIIVFLAFFVFGLFNFKKFLKKQTFYKNLLDFLGVLKTEIGFFKNDINLILEKTNYAFEFENLLKTFKKDKELKTFEANFLKESEKSEITSFFSKLGRADVWSQSKDIEAFEKMIETKICELKNVHAKKAKMQFSLTIMLGLLVVVLII